MRRTVPAYCVVVSEPTMEGTRAVQDRTVTRMMPLRTLSHIYSTLFARLLEDGCVSTHRCFCRREIPPRSLAKADTQFAGIDASGKPRLCAVHYVAAAIRGRAARVIPSPHSPVTLLSYNDICAITLGDYSNEERERYTVRLSRYLTMARGILYAVD